MNRILVFLFLLCSFSLSAQEVDTTPHKHRFIELVNNGEFEEAKNELLLIEDLNSYFKSLGADSLLMEYKKKLDFVVKVYREAGFYNEAIRCQYLSAEITKSFVGENNIDYISSWLEIGNLWYLLNDFEAAEMSAIYVLEKYRLLFGENDLRCVVALNALSHASYQQSKFDLALNCNLEILKIRRENLGDNHPDCLSSLQNIGLIYTDMGDYEKAETYYLEALKNRNRMSGLLDKENANFYSDIGMFYSEIGNYIKAEEYYLKSLEFSQKQIDEFPDDVLECMNRLANLYLTIGNYQKAETIYLDVLKESNRRYGDLDIDYANYLCNIGVFYLNQSNFLEAEKLLLKAKEIYLDLSLEKHRNYVTLLNNIGNLYIELGNYSKAKMLILEALEKRRQLFGDAPHTDIANSLHSLALVLSELGNNEDADYFLLTALDIQKEIYGDLSLEVADLYGNLSVIKSREGNDKVALEYNLKAMNIFENRLGRSHYDYLGSLNNLCVLYGRLSNYSDMEKGLLAVIKNLNEYNYTSHRLYPVVLDNLAYLYYIQGIYDKARMYYVASSKYYRESISSSLGYMTNQEREYFWNTMKNIFAEYCKFSYNYHFTNPSISTFAYDNELFCKGLLLNSADAVRRSILESGDSALIEQWNELTSAKQVVMHLEKKEPSSSQLDIYRHRADSLEKIVTKSSAVFRESKEQWNINWESVKKQLSKNEVAIEYFSAPLSQDSTMYCALLLRHNSKYPALIPLFEEKEVTSYLDNATEGTINNLYSIEGEGEHVSNIVWSKILSKINPGETIYFAPTGILHQLGIEYLLVDSARTMSDVYNMVRLSSTREIVTNKLNESNKSAVVYGGIHYDLDNKTILTESNLYPGLKRSSLENDSINRGSAKFLPGTKEEAEKINKLLTDNKIEAKIFKTKAANEESFKSLSGKHNNILHIATHGFTWTDSTARKQDYFADRMQMQLVGDNQMRGPIIDPLDRCGLLFAGANTALQGKSKELPEGVQDGILTAKEISLMDLRDAELVVLSACETAKGDITSEGVFGLQRAFKMAGAKTIIMSLWKVDDRATQLLMTEFYTNWIAKKQPKREAFRNAQNTVRYAKDKDGDYMYNNPIYWAGFVMLD